MTNKRVDVNRIAENEREQRQRRHNSSTDTSSIRDSSKRRRRLDHVIAKHIFLLIYVHNDLYDTIVIRIYYSRVRRKTTKIRLGSFGSRITSSKCHSQHCSSNEQHGNACMRAPPPKELHLHTCDMQLLALAHTLRQLAMHCAGGE